MKNLNYDLLKLLHSKLDNVWRLENHYVDDAEKEQSSVEVLKQILEDEKKHVELLRAELKTRMETDEMA